MTTASTTPEFKEPKTWRVHHLMQAKQAGRKLTMLTAYDALTARILEAGGVDLLLVGDSYGNVMLGFDGTLEVSLEHMQVATRAVAHAVSKPLVVADLPFGSYEASPQQAFTSAASLMKQGANAVKLEGGQARVDAVRLLTSSGIPVVGHLGFTPQSENTLGGPRMQGRGAAAQQVIDDALALQESGVCALVLELVPAPLATEITKLLRIPVIGIGAGPETDGQVLVWSDMAGMTDWAPSFVKKFAELGPALRQATEDYCNAVKEGSFPAENNYRME
ncbi:3-methyl-2-oxobutanoate hydroxymethyltransferase [Gleimia coleocanis DSM 15436]|uniref:3-methyl-2-oxobutanoate hydroxymethyltransferase n=1 Tax=Gleimia coleocanis DSM 15436 TaxID=525245 RepID=C0W1E2_9ACTO|nr:3-methyl-2-oxobutanoate hydroxymethyltransferase [Gleimia coleocanis]EEH63515.1 3-methyl-2-oxobutanoate hydroxymethyltransferase [Gleimia coleocanis DSM 15436]